MELGTVLNVNRQFYSEMCLTVVFKKECISDFFFFFFSINLKCVVYLFVNLMTFNMLFALLLTWC